MSRNKTIVIEAMVSSTAADDHHDGLAEGVQHKSAESWALTEMCPPLTITVVGAGNTGSAAACLLARVEGVRELRLIDDDVYEERNMMGQSMPAGARPGMLKVNALATAIRRMRPNLRVVPIAERVQKIPPGEVFDATAVFSNLDGVTARRYVVERAWEFGTPVIDCGVLGDARLVRVTVYVPDPRLACVICPIDPAAGVIFEQTYPCAGGDTEPTPARTDAPAWLGTMAASFQLAEFEKIVGAGPGHLVAGQELLVDARSHQLSVSTVPRNPECPFHHRQWRITRLGCTPGDLSVAGALALALPPGTQIGGNLPRLLRGTSLSLAAPTQQFVRTTECGQCGHRRSLLRLRDRLRQRDLICPAGHGDMLPTPADIVDRLYPASLDRLHMSQSLYAAGFRNGDQFTVSAPHGDLHFLFRYERAGAGLSGEEQRGIRDRDAGAASPFGV